MAGLVSGTLGLDRRATVLDLENALDLPFGRDPESARRDRERERCTVPRPGCDPRSASIARSGRRENQMAGLVSGTLGLDRLATASDLEDAEHLPLGRDSESARRERESTAHRCAARLQPAPLRVSVVHVARVSSGMA